MPWFPTTLAGQQQEKLHKETTTGHSKSSTSGASGSSHRYTPTTNPSCGHSPTEAQAAAEKTYMALIATSPIIKEIESGTKQKDKLTPEESKQYYDEITNRENQYDRAWTQSTCRYQWYPRAFNYTPEGGKRKHRRKTQKKRKAKAKSHKRR